MKIIICWVICILCYIFNIVWVSIFGANIINNIMGWACCIMLALSMLFSELRWKKERDKYIDDIIEIVLGDYLRNKEKDDDNY